MLWAEGDVAPNHSFPSQNAAVVFAFAFIALSLLTTKVTTLTLNSGIGWQAMPPNSI